MKKLLLVALMLLAFPAYAQNVSKGDIQRLQDLILDVDTMVVTGGINSSGVVYSTTLKGNPLVHCKTQAVTPAQILAGTVLLTGETGKSIKLHSVKANVNGTATPNAGTDTFTLRDTNQPSGADPIITINSGALNTNNMLGPQVSGWTERSSFNGLASGGSLRAASSGSNGNYQSMTNIVYNLCYTYQ